MAKILVTGGAGFIGHGVVARLEQLGHKCVILDNRTNYGIVSSEEMITLHAERSALYQAPVHAIDLADNDSNVEWIVRHYQPDTVIHLASFPRQKVVTANPRWGSDVMMGGTMSLLESARMHGVKRFVYISSSMVYGNFVQPVSEHDACNPIGQYGIMKLAGEWLVKDYARHGNFDYTIVRPSAVYGPRDIEDRVVSKFLTAAMRGETIRVKGANEMLDFTYVDDAVAGIVAATLDPQGANSTYNITRGASHTLLEAAELAVSIVGQGNIEIHDKDPAFPSRAGLKIDRARQELGFIPQVDLREGFQRYYEWLTK
jgi:nucleoside-diphosphate-sugar epimerase